MNSLFKKVLSVSVLAGAIPSLSGSAWSLGNSNAQSSDTHTIAREDIKNINGEQANTLDMTDFVFFTTVVVVYFAFIINLFASSNNKKMDEALEDNKTINEGELEKQESSSEELYTSLEKERKISALKEEMKINKTTLEGLEPELERVKCAIKGQKETWQRLYNEIDWKNVEKSLKGCYRITKETIDKEFCKFFKKLDYDENCAANLLNILKGSIYKKVEWYLDYLAKCSKELILSTIGYEKGKHDQGISYYKERKDEAIAKREAAYKACANNDVFKVTYKFNSESGEYEYYELNTNPSNLPKHLMNLMLYFDNIKETLDDDSLKYKPDELKKKVNDAGYDAKGKLRYFGLYDSRYNISLTRVTHSSLKEFSDRFIKDFSSCWTDFVNMKNKFKKENKTDKEFCESFLEYCKKKLKEAKEYVNAYNDFVYNDNHLGLEKENSEYCLKKMQKYGVTEEEASKFMYKYRIDKLCSDFSADPNAYLKLLKEIYNSFQKNLERLRIAISTFKENCDYENGAILEEKFKNLIDNAKFQELLKTVNNRIAHSSGILFDTDELKSALSEINKIFVNGIKEIFQGETINNELSNKVLTEKLGFVDIDNNVYFGENFDGLYKQLKKLSETESKISELEETEKKLGKICDDLRDKKNSLEKSIVTNLNMKSSSLNN